MILLVFVKIKKEIFDFVSHYSKDCPTELGSEIISVKSVKYFNSLLKKIMNI